MKSLKRVHKGQQTSTKNSTKLANQLTQENIKNDNVNRIKSKITQTTDNNSQHLYELTFIFTICGCLADISHMFVPRTHLRLC